MRSLSPPQTRKRSRSVSVSVSEALLLAKLSRREQGAAPPEGAGVIPNPLVKTHLYNRVRQGAEGSRATPRRRKTQGNARGQKGLKERRKKGVCEPDLVLALRAAHAATAIAAG